MTARLRGLCSKATAALLTDLSSALEERGGPRVHFEAAGGVDVARRVRGGETADVLVLADGAMRALEDEGLLAAGSLRPLFLSEVVVGVPEDAPAPSLDTVEDLLALLRGAGSIGYSTGPSGAAFVDRLEQWGLTGELGPRLVQAPPGVPVARLVAEGLATVGIQQRSELAGAPGVRVVGPLPGAASVTSTFSGAALARSADTEAATDVVRLFASELARDLVAAHGMRPAAP